jgi:hypothetical protein
MLVLWEHKYIFCLSSAREQLKTIISCLHRKLFLFYLFVLYDIHTKLLILQSSEEEREYTAAGRARKEK